MADIKERLGRRIRQFRQMRNLTQEELAERANLSVTFIGMTERGKNIPSVKTCQKIASVLGLPIHELFLFDEQSDKDRRIDQLTIRLKENKNKKIVGLVLEIGEVILNKG